MILGCGWILFVPQFHHFQICNISLWINCWNSSWRLEQTDQVTRQGLHFISLLSKMLCYLYFFWVQLLWCLWVPFLSWNLSQQPFLLCMPLELWSVISYYLLNPGAEFGHTGVDSWSPDITVGGAPGDNSNQCPHGAFLAHQRTTRITLRGERRGCSNFDWKLSFAPLGYHATLVLSS